MTEFVICFGLLSPDLCCAHSCVFPHSKTLDFAHKWLDNELNEVEFNKARLHLKSAVRQYDVVINYVMIRFSEHIVGIISTFGKEH